MSDRVFKRVPVNIEGEIISYRDSYPAFIRNISEYGIHERFFSHHLSAFVRGALNANY